MSAMRKKGGKEVLSRAIARCGADYYADVPQSCSTLQSQHACASSMHRARYPMVQAARGWVANACERHTSCPQHPRLSILLLAFHWTDQVEVVTRRLCTRCITLDSAQRDTSRQSKDHRCMYKKKKERSLIPLYTPG